MADNPILKFVNDCDWKRTCCSDVSSATFCIERIPDPKFLPIPRFRIGGETRLEAGKRSGLASERPRKISSSFRCRCWKSNYIGKYYTYIDSLGVGVLSKFLKYLLIKPSHKNYYDITVSKWLTMMEDY